MREVVVTIPAQEYRVSIDEDENDLLDKDSIYDYYVYQVISDQLNYIWVIEEKTIEKE